MIKKGAYYVNVAESIFSPTPLTIGPWSGKFQHAGPPSALVTRAIEIKAAELGHPLVPRISVFILKPIPAASDCKFEVGVSVIRSGSAVSHVEATMKWLKSNGKRDEVLRAHAVCYREDHIEGLPRAALDRENIPLPRPVAECPEVAFPMMTWLSSSRTIEGYNTSMSLKEAKGTLCRGPCAIWSRINVNVVEGELPTPLQRLMAFVDSGNGISATALPTEFGFMNCDLTVHLNRMPKGEWFCMDARTDMTPAGFGLATTQLFDESGFIGVSNQSLFVSTIGKSPTKL